MMQPIRSMDDLLRRAQALSRRPRLAVAMPYEGEVLASARRAQDLGLIEVTLVGDSERASQAARTAGVDISDFHILQVRDDNEAIHSAVSLVRDGAADLLMKGLVSTKRLAKIVLGRRDGLREEGFLSQVAAFVPPNIPRLFILTDAGINIAPNFSRKVKIVQNAIEVARRLGIPRPRVAMIAAVEQVELPAMPATLDARVMEHLSESGKFGDALVQGPLGLDNAVSEELAHLKGIEGEVAGRADILCVPDIETGNVLYKTLTCFCGVEMASALVGATAPIVLTSRSDTAQTKLYSIAFAALLAHSNPVG